MSNFDKSFSYESLLDTLRATHETRKKRFEEKKHLLNDADRLVERTLFRLEDDALFRNENIDEKDAMFNFEEFMNEISNGFVIKGGFSGSVCTGMGNSQDAGHHHIISSDTPHDNDSSSNSAVIARKHVCPRPGCKKSYTSSHGLKYHMLNGHSKEKEEVYKPFVCNIGNCDKAYRNSNGLKYHMDKVHQIRKY